jgi:histidine triad (HIT) family protein
VSLSAVSTAESADSAFQADFGGDSVANCAFCSIIAGEIEADIVHRDDLTLAFLDHRPLFPGHVLVVPVHHHETLPDLPAGEIEPLFATVRRLSAAVPVALDAEGSFVAANNVVSQSVPHLHVHVVPRRRKDGLRGFFWPRTPYDDDEHRRRVADRIRETLAESA